MKIMLVHNRYRSSGPSGENLVVDTEAAALAEAGHDVTGFGRDSDEIESWPLARKALLPAQVVWSRRAGRELSAALRAGKPDVVHVHNTIPLLSDAVLYACRDAGVPVVATLHNYRLGCLSGDFYRAGSVCRDCAGGAPLPGVLHGCYRGSRAASVPLALAIGAHRPAWRTLVSAYAFISAAQRDLLAWLRLPPERQFVRHNMIPRRDRLAVPRTPTVLYAGRLAEAKGLRLLMEGWDRYLAGPGAPALRLVIAGTGPLDREVAGWASSRPSVTMAGLVSREHCSELMAAARAVVIPSVWEEAFGLVAVEAMAAGTAPIATRRGALPELVTAGVDGVLFGADDPAALAAAIADADATPGKYEEYGKRARATYEQRFDPDASLARLVEIYRFAIENPASGPAVHRRRAMSPMGS